MSQASREAYNKLQNTQSLKYNDFDVTRDWKQSSLDPYNAIIFNPNDPNQAFSVSNQERGAGISSFLGDSMVGKDELYNKYYSGKDQNYLRQIALSPQDFAVQKASKTGVQGAQLNAIKGNDPLASFNSLSTTDTSTGNSNTENQLGALQNTTQLGTSRGGFSLTGGNLNTGSRGDNVKQLQTLLGTTPDGIYGPQTKAAVMKFQQENGLKADGIVGPLTTQALNAKFGQSGTNTQTGTQSGLGGTTGTTTGGTTGSTGTSNIGTQLGANGGLDSAYSDYEKLIKPSDEESNIQSQISALDASKQLGIQGVEEQPIAMPFISGQSAAIEKRANIQAQTLQQRLANAQAKRMASMDVAKARYGYESDKAQLAKTTATAKPTSVQEYEYAKSQGYTGTYNQYQDLDANRKAKVAGAGTAGLTSAQINSTVNQIAQSFDNEPVVKEYNTIARNVDTYKNLGNSATDDIQRVYTFAKVADPNSAVKEGEYNSIEKYSQALLQRAGIKVSRVFTPTGILTPEARTAMGNTLQTSLNSAKKTYDNVQTQYKNRIEQAKSGNFNSITDYSQAYNTPQNQPSKFDYLAPKISIKGKNSYIDSNVWNSLSASERDGLWKESVADGYPLIINK